MVKKWCGKNEDSIRRNNLAQKFRTGNAKKFWGEIKKLNPERNKTPQKIDGISGVATIGEFWRGKFSSILNGVDDAENRLEYLLKKQAAPRKQVSLVSLEELCLIFNNLPPNKTPQTDDIPTEIFSMASFDMIGIFSIFFNAVLVHGHVPCLLADVGIIPTIKSKIKDPSKSSNYRLEDFGKTSS